MQNFLLVDDDKIFHFLGIRALQRIGFTNDQIQTALNGREAMEILNNQWYMPIMNGFEFLEVFRTLSVEKRNVVKIVVLSSSSNTLDIERAMKLGATQCLTKPLTEDMLLGVLSGGNERTEAA